MTDTCRFLRFCSLQSSKCLDRSNQNVVLIWQAPSGSTKTNVHNFRRFDVSIVYETYMTQYIFACAQTTIDLVACRVQKPRSDRNGREIAHSICATKSKRSDNDISMKLKAFYR